jgi:hypothetical protein
MVYSGDCHEYIVDTHIENCIALSTGSISMQAVNESPHKKVNILFDDFSFKSYDLITRPFKLLLVKTKEHLEYILDTPKENIIGVTDFEAIPEWIRKPIVIVKCNNKLEFGFNRLVEKFAEWHSDVVPLNFDSAEIVKAYSDNPDITDTVDVGNCIETAVGCKASQLYKDSVRLFFSNDVKQELESMRTEHMEDYSDATVQS